MNPQVIVDFLKPKLEKQGFKTVRLAWQTEPDREFRDVPALMVFSFKDSALGEDRGDNFSSQIVREHFGLQIVCAVDELEDRRTQVREAIYGEVLPGRVFEVNFAEGENQVLNRSIQWWVDIYYTQLDWRNAP